MKTVKWHVSIGIQGRDRSDEFEVEDHTPLEDIEEMVIGAVFEHIEWDWSIETPPAAGDE
jgi:hypothetical protein